MLSMLPSYAQERVMDMLNHGDFISAKAIYDQWNNKPDNSARETRDNDNTHRISTYNTQHTISI